MPNSRVLHPTTARAFPNLPVTSRNEAGVLVLTLSGHLDRTMAEYPRHELRQALDQAQEEGVRVDAVVLDCQNVSYLEAAVVRDLLRVQRLLRAREIRVALAGLHPIIEAQFALVPGVRGQFEVYDDAKSAREALRPPLAVTA